MKKYFLLLLLFLPLLLLADWGDEEENNGVYQWAPIKPYDYNIQVLIQDVAVYDSLNAVALVQRGDFQNLEVWKSTDGAQSWDIIYSEYGSNSRTVSTIQYPSPNYIYITGYSYPSFYILKSTDAGITWDTITTPHYRFGGWLCMYDSLTGVCKSSFQSKEDLPYADTTIYMSEIAYTDDGCKTWTMMRPDTILKYATSAHQFHFFSPDHFAVIDSRFSTYGKGPIYYWTTDRGKTWSIRYLTDLARANLQSMSFINDSIGWIAAAQGTGEGDLQYDILFKTTDGGDTWELNYKEKNNIQHGMNDVKFLDENVGMATGGFGKIFRTTDGGDTWIREYGKDPEHVKCKEGQWDEAHLQIHPIVRFEYFGTKPIVWTTQDRYQFWEEHPFTVAVETTQKIEDFVLYPNPVHSGEFLYTNYEPAYKANVLIYSLTGELIKTARFNSNAFYIDADFVSGTYFIVIEADGKIIAREKFIVE